MDRPIHLAGLLPDDLHRQVSAQGVTLREVRRFLAHNLSLRPEKRRPVLPIRKAAREILAAATVRDHLEVVERVTDPDDGFVKYLFRSPDGALSEAVRIPLEAEDTFSVCLSSQVGCAMGCTFCATGRLGLSRDLEAWEMVSAFCVVRDEAPGRLKGAVFMGQGEPFHNYDRVIQAARVLSHPCGGRIGQEAITISTVGLAPAIRRYGAEGHRYRLIVSLTSAVEAKRAELMPVTRKVGLEELGEAIRAVARSTGGRVTIAWVVMSGVNTGQDEVDALRELLGDVPLRINLIDVNDDRRGGYGRADPEELGAFWDRLRTLGMPVVRRYSGGRNRDAACGMLAARRHQPVVNGPGLSG